MLAKVEARMKARDRQQVQAKPLSRLRQGPKDIRWSKQHHGQRPMMGLAK